MMIYKCQVETGSDPQDDGTVRKRYVVVPRLMELSGRGEKVVPRKI